MRPWHSLRRKLPLLISALLCVVVTAVCWSAYREVEDALLRAAGGRLTGVTQQLAGMLEESARRVRRDVRQLAGDSTLVAFLAHPSAATRDGARRALIRAHTRAPQVVSAALWDRDRTPQLVVDDAAAAAVRAGAGSTTVSDPSAPGAPGAVQIGPLVRTETAVLYRAVSPVLGRTRDTVGFLVVQRRVASGPEVQRIGRLIGSGATLLLGNARGDLWTDLSRAVVGPPTGGAAAAPVEYTAAAGRRMLAVAMPVGSTPWLVAVSIPRQVALAPARRYLLNVAAVALVLVGIGAAGAWALSRQVTAPLAEVSRAAEDVARGDYTRRVAVRRPDELGSLAASFNSMAAQVEAASHDLSAHARELEAANAELRDSEERYRRLVEAAHEGICAVDPAGTITYANARLAEMLGYAAHELPGRPIFDLVEPAAAFEERTQFARRQRGIAEMREVPFRRADGSTVWVAESVSPLPDADGTFSGALFMLSDVTERRAAEERLRASERHFRALTEHASDMVSVIDGCGVTRYRSPAFGRHTGYAEADLVSTPMADRIHPDDLPAVRTALAQVTADPGRRAQLEYRYRHKDGRWLSFSSVATNLLADPAVEGVVVNTRDVTEQRALEAQLRQAQKMDAVGQLAGGVAHDFNNLLTVMSGYTGILLAELPESDPARADIEEIRRAAERAAGLTRQLLAFSRQQVLQPRILDVNAVVRDLEKMLGRVLREDVRLETLLNPRLGRVNADPGQLEQVIVNLVVNARDAMPAGGALTIETADVELDEAYGRFHTDVTPGPYVMLAVSDTGVGMSAETQARIFEPFFTTKAAGQGTGLGLSTVYGIVKQSGGHVWVYSEPGIGTTFKVYLPRVSAAPAAPAARSRDGQHPALHRGSETILLVEDEPQVRSAARRILERAGYTVLEAANGTEALRLGEGHGAAVDLLLTDMVMPDLSGRELATRFGARFPRAATAFMSGYTEDTVLRQGLFEPDTVFIQKPFTPEALTRKVREALAIGSESPVTV